MLFQDTVERSAELLRKALPLMSRQATALHPTSYAVWYAYVAGIYPALRNDIDDHLARHGALDEAATESLFRRHLSEMDPALAQRVTTGMQKLLTGMNDSAVEASEQSARYGAVLDDMAADIQAEIQADVHAENRLAAEAEKLELLRSHTEEMQSAMSQLQQRLADSQREIETLRTEVLRARHDSLRDALTGLANRRAFDQQLSAGLSAMAAAPHLPPPCLLMLDIDHFKHINDTYGHAFGDQVLKGVAQVLKSVVDPPAVAARVGGEEFAVLVPTLSLPQAESMAERLRIAVSATRVRRKDSDDVVARVTTSLGVASAQPGDTAHSLVDRADRALYVSKANGRDRVTVSA